MSEEQQILQAALFELRRARENLQALDGRRITDPTRSRAYHNAAVAVGNVLGDLEEETADVAKEDHGVLRDW